MLTESFKSKNSEQTATGTSANQTGPVKTYKLAMLRRVMVWGPGWVCAKTCLIGLAGHNYEALFSLISCIKLLALAIFPIYTLTVIHILSI